ncbi:uncharacterized protein [Eurosta solidaginis]|uniref:uncharacterized protein n=1 Tax=Eurosta solidaginis TaxID=178769 RepID=UPI0035313F97
MDVIQEMKEMDQKSLAIRVAASTSSARTKSTSTTTTFKHSCSCSNILASGTLTTKPSTTNLSNSTTTKTYFNRTTSAVTRKRGGLAIAIKKQNSADDCCSNENIDNNSRNNTPLNSRQSSYSLPSPPQTPGLPTLRRGLSVRVSEASTAICIGEEEKEADSKKTTQQQSLTRFERFWESLLRFFYKIMGSRTPSEAEAYDYYDYYDAMKI